MRNFIKTTLAALIFIIGGSQTVFAESAAQAELQKLIDAGAIADASACPMPEMLDGVLNCTPENASKEANRLKQETITESKKIQVASLGNTWSLLPTKKDRLVLASQKNKPLQALKVAALKKAIAAKKAKSATAVTIVKADTTPFKQKIATGDVEIVTEPKKAQGSAKPNQTKTASVSNKLRVKCLDMAHLNGASNAELRAAGCSQYIAQNQATQGPIFDPSSFGEIKVQTINRCNACSR